MKLLQFDELTYPYVPEIGWETRFSNRFCDPQLVHQTYMEHMEQWACSRGAGLRWHHDQRAPLHCFQYPACL